VQQLFAISNEKKDLELDKTNMGLSGLELVMQSNSSL